MKNCCTFFGLIGFLFCLNSCESLEKTDLVRSEVITNVKGKNLVYKMYLTGTDKYRYNFMLASPKDTTQLFETHFTDESANYVEMEVEQNQNSLKILIDKQIEPQAKTIDGFTYKLEATK